MMNNTHKKFSIVVLISGNGSNLQAIIDAIHNNNLPIEINVVISNEAAAYGLTRAHNAKIPTHIIPHKNFATRDDFDNALRLQIDQYHPDLLVLAGFMRRLGSNFIAHYQNRMINIHPSLLPKYRGLHTHQKALAAGDTLHGVTIHFVTDDLDGGPIIAQATVPIEKNDSEESLKHRVQMIEHKLYPTIIDWFAQGRIQSQGDQIALDGKLLPATGVMLKF